MHNSGTPNRLIREKSPYLLQHAYNPVDWYPWGEEAFEKARREDKPIFLSVGYSTCHWCHVMERESFVDQGVADLLNKGFVSIKVDREERPDVDHVYMEAVMAMTGAGGWPMSVFLTPDLKPFYGGTYFPPRDGHGRPGFGTVLLAIEDKWKNDRSVLHDAGGRLTDAIRDRAVQSGQIPEVRYPELAARAFQELEMRYDSECGGFGEAPKFPTPHVLSFLLLDSIRSGRSEAQAMAEGTLEAMARGGLRDALGGGFHRYSTDERWHVPHFEKMLYDQALLVRAYAEAFQLTGKNLYREVAVEIMEYVLRDLTSPQGAFYSAEDADSAEDAQHPDYKTEGAFYAWTLAEIRQALEPREAEVFASFYGCGESGNVLQDPFGEFQNKNVLYQTGSMEEVASRLGLEPGEVKILLDRARPRLLEWRNRRPRPHRDDKVLTDWNGLMISAMAYAGRVLGEPRFVAAAEKAADFILSSLMRTDGRLLHRWREGEAAIPGFLDDYAFLLLGLIDLFTASQKADYLKAALRLAKDLIWLFEDDTGGPGLFFTARDAEVLFTRQKTYYDGAVPAGNSAGAWALAQLSLISENPVFREKTRRVLHGHLNTLGDRSSLYPLALLAFDLLDGGGEEIVLAGDGGGLSSWFEMLGKEYAPGRMLILNPSGERGEPVRRLLPFLSQRSLVQGKVTAWVCRRGACLPPVTSREVLSRVLQGGAGQGG